MTKTRILGVFRVIFRAGLASRPEFLFTIQIREAPGLLGATDIISLAYADLAEADYLIVAREEVALARKWIEKPFAKAPRHAYDSPTLAKRRQTPAQPRKASNPFEE